MPSPLRVFAAAVVLAGALAPSALAQASPYIPLDDPRLPLLEHLIARGDVEDPSPMARPFRRVDAARVLAAADTSSSKQVSTLVRSLRLAFGDPPGNTWAFDRRLGLQAYSHPRPE